MQHNIITIAEHVAVALICSVFVALLGSVIVGCVLIVRLVLGV